MNTKTLFSHKSDIWKTPNDIYALFMKDLKCFDPCPIDPTEDGLQIEWKKMNYVNPPYSEIEKWVDKSLEEANKGKTIFLLVPSRTDTKWFHKILEYGATFFFIKGRINFSNKGSAPFPSVLIRIEKNQKSADNKIRRLYRSWFTRPYQLHHSGCYQELLTEDETAARTKGF